MRGRGSEKKQTSNRKGRNTKARRTDNNNGENDILMLTRNVENKRMNGEKKG